MLEEEAKEILEAKLKAGQSLHTAAQGDFRGIKRLLEKCLEDDIPCMLGPCTVSS